MAVRVTQDVAVVAYDATVDARVTAFAAEVSTLQPADARVTAIALEVIIPANSPPVVVSGRKPVVFVIGG